MNLIDQFNTNYTHLYWKSGGWNTLTYLFHNSDTKEALCYNFHIYAIVIMDVVPADFVEVKIDNNKFNSKELVLEDIRHDHYGRTFMKFIGEHLLYTVFQDGYEVSECGYLIHEGDAGYQRWLKDYDIAKQPKLNIVANWQAYLDLH